LNYKPEAEETEPLLKEDGLSKALKRALDIIASGTILLLTSPLLILIAIIIKLESKGPVFYKSNRAGSNYKIFKFLKFRTMYVGSDAKLKEMMHLNQYSNGENGSQVFFKIASDPRITKFGAFLRNTSLDEIPQLINVLKGDMSLVGNRPLPLYEAVSLTKDEWVERFLAPAGITGLWQITKRGQKDMTVHERINLDINYANKNSFLYDLWILIKTPRALIQKENV
jgi:lipopolysaccharide/colanic/teichoic acid biosynthesis glycosyltransferase